MFAKNDFLAWLIGAYGFHKDDPYGDIEFHWPKLVLTLFGLGLVSQIWAQADNYNMMKDNIDEIISVEIVKEAGKVLADMDTSSDKNISMNTRLSKFKKDLKSLIKECKYDTRKGNSNTIRSRVQKLQHDAERVLSNPNNKESLQALVNSINSVFEVCIDKNKLAKMEKKPDVTKEGWSIDISEDEDFFLTESSYDSEYDDEMYLEASMMDYSNEELWVRGMPSNMIASVTAKFLKAGINGRVKLALNNWKKMYNDPQTPLMNVKRAVSNVAVQLREYLQKVAAHEDPSDNRSTALRILSSMLEAQRTNDPNKIVIS